MSSKCSDFDMRKVSSVWTLWSCHHGAFNDTQSTDNRCVLPPNLGGGVDSAHTHTHLPEFLIHWSEAELPSRSSSAPRDNTLRADYRSKLVWGDPTHPSRGDAVVWKSNRPPSQKKKKTQRRPKSNWGFDLPCCWHLFSLLSQLPHVWRFFCPVTQKKQTKNPKRRLISSANSFRIKSHSDDKYFWKNATFVFLLFLAFFRCFLVKHIYFLYLFSHLIKKT